MKKSCLIFLGSVLSLSGIPSSNAAEDCKPAPDCAALGFTQSAADCSGAALKCPWNLTKAACKAGVKPVTCAVGSILGGDQLCYADKLPDNVKPIGIVFDTANRLAVALTDVKEDGSAGSSTMIWSAKNYDIPALGNCSSADVTTCGVDGRANTTAILNCGSSCGTTYVANGANAYEPSGCSKDFCKKTKWFLPSMRDLITLYNAKSYVNASLSLTASSGAKTLTENWYWSSTEYSNGSAWTLRVSDGNRYNYGKNYYYYVRPVIYYGNESKTETGDVCTDEKWYLYLNFAGSKSGETCYVKEANSSVIVKSESGKQGKVTEIALSSGSINSFNSWSNWAQIAPNGGMGSNGYIGSGSSYISSFSKRCSDTITGVDFNDKDGDLYLTRYVENNGTVKISWDYNDDVSCSGDVKLIIEETYN